MSLFLTLVFSAIGFAFVMYAKKTRNAVALISGCALMVMPYFINALIVMLVVGAVLVLLPKFIKL